MNHGKELAVIWRAVIFLATLGVGMVMPLPYIVVYCALAVGLYFYYKPRMGRAAKQGIYAFEWGISIVVIIAALQIFSA